MARHGLGFLAGITGLERWVRFHHGVLGHQPREQPYTNPEHLRLALEQLGPTFIKLGQLLSTRSDLLPPDYLQELAKLQDGAPPVPGDTVRELIRQELGTGPEELFAEFDEEPLASASIGQAHAATLEDGTPVVVKVRRPGVVARIQEDLEILQNLAAQATRRWDAAADYNLTGIAGEFARTLRAELDYLQEGRNAERFAENFARDPGLHIPRVFWHTTTSRVLTLERVSGLKVDDLDGLDRAGIDRRALANRAVGAIAKMIFEDGFFHADPHPGNLFIETGGRIGLIDFGMVGEVDEKLRQQLAVLLVALARADPERAGPALLDLSVAKRPVDRAQLRADLAAVMALYQDRRLAEIEIAPLIGKLLALLRDHHLQLPREIVLILKMVLMAEGMGVRLDPEFNVAETLNPYAQRLALQSLSPFAYAKRLGRAGVDAAELGAELPGKLRRILDAIDTDGFELHLRAAEIEPLLGRAERIGNRVVAGLIAAAFIRGLGELVVADKDEFRRWARPLMGAGLGAAGTLGSYLAWTGRRKKR
nr:AarF/ABC1/UbiB kinase family protein [Arthrobacter sp. SF27]